jgi:hypothetical protein
MKTQVIQLEAHDDTVSVKDKIEWSQTHRVLLIWPPRGKILQNRLDLVFLERHCAALGSQLAVVTKNPEVRFHAQQAGIPVFKSRKKAQLESWRRSWRLYRRRRLQQEAAQARKMPFSLTSSPEQPSEPPLLARLAIFTLGVIAVLALAAFLFPHAEVQVPPQTSWAEVTIPILASPDIATVQVSGSVPSREITTSAEIRDQIPTTGSIEIPDTYAEGQVVFTNLTPNPLIVPKSTLVSTTGETGVFYLTQQEVSLPGGVGEEQTARIRALDPGEAGNQPADTIRAVEASLGANLTVHNPEPVSGGTNTLLPSPSNRDREQLTQTVRAALSAKALAAFEEQLGPGDALLSREPVLNEIEIKRFQPEADQPGDTLTLTMRVQFSAWVVREDDLERLGQKVMAARRTEGSVPLPETLEITNLNEPLLQDNRYGSWSIQVRWQEEHTWDIQEMTSLLLGQDPTQAKERMMDHYNLEQPPQITLNPPWWPRLPFLPFRVSIKT